MVRLVDIIILSTRARNSENMHRLSGVYLHVELNKESNFVSLKMFSDHYNHLVNIKMQDQKIIGF